jgi:hypothetical protein
MTRSNEPHMDLLYRLDRDPCTLGTGGHLLYVGERKDS